MTGLQREGIIL